jgi:hypothetical protein
VSSRGCGSIIRTRLSRASPAFAAPGFERLDTAIAVAFELTFVRQRVITHLRINLPSESTQLGCETIWNGARLGCSTARHRDARTEGHRYGGIVGIRVGGSHADILGNACSDFSLTSSSSRSSRPVRNSTT